MPKPIRRFLGCLGLAGAAAIGTNATTPYCRAPGNHSAAARIGIIDLLTSTNSAVAQIRSDWGFAGLDSTQVVQLSDEAKCQRGSAAIDSVRGYVLSGAAVYVFAVGPTRYAVDPGVSTGKEMRGVFLFDTLWSLKGRIAVPNAPW